MEVQLKRLMTATIAAALVLSACTMPARSEGAASDPGTGPTTTDPGTTLPVAEPKTAPEEIVAGTRHPSAARALMPFDACDDLVDWAVGHALDRVGPYGLDGLGPYRYAALEVGRTASRDEAMFETTTTTAEASGAAILGTNLQEVGVDEPDLVKTDGRRIVAVNGSTLHLVSIDGDELTLEGSIDLDFWTQDLFLDGDRVIAIAGGELARMPLWDEFGRDDSLMTAPPTPIVTVVEIDISDLADPEPARTLQVDGRYVSSRMVDGAVRLVVSSHPTGFAWVYPEGGGLRAEREAEDQNRAIVEDSQAANWLPYYILTDHNGRDRVIAEGTVLACDRTHRPEEFSGLTTLSLVTLDSETLDVADATGVFADGDIVYSSSDATYVATSRWIDPAMFESGNRPDRMETMVHKFTLSERSAEYQASGAVPGHMLSQWSMSEYDGYLRVASTDTPEWWGGEESESMVTVLDTVGDELRTVGSVDGLGRGERIYAVRFFGHLGYVVTFRQVDPLYVIDLSDPKQPVVKGELKIPGYSAYLHPIGDNSLLGVGQDADLDGGIRGLQASLFDVSNPDDPARLDRYTMSGGHSEVEWNHHAFMHDPSSGLTVFPFERWEGAKADVPPTGALVLTVTEDGIREIGEVSHDDNGLDWWMPIRRSLLIDGALITISEAGIMVSDTETLETTDWITFE